MTFKESNCSRHQSGIALIIVLLVITVLAILAGGFAYSMKVETQLARNASFGDDLFWVAWGGLESAKWRLSADLRNPQCGPGVDCLQEAWAGGAGCDLTNSASPFEASAVSVLDQNRLVFDAESDAHTTIVDAERKFNINIAGQPILQQAMMLIGVDPAAQSTIMDSIDDWRDTDKDPKGSGAEDDFYQSGQGPYGLPHRAKNGPIDDISELRMINGVTRAIYEGSGAIDTTAALATVEAARSRFDEPIYAVGLRDLFCTVSSRVLNVNTAAEITLQLLPPIDNNIAAIIVEERAKAPFRNIQDLVQRVPPLGPVLQQMPEIQQYIGFQSRVFEVTIEARIGGQRRTYVGVLLRNNQNDIQVLAFAPKWD